ncbi:MAG: caspase family protein, partial [Chitinophagaceae bacterium]
KTLERQKFDSNNIKTLINQEATKAGIVTAMKDLIGRVNKNSKDVVYIHISSHGAQMEDDANKDETDGLDEAIVSINARWTDDRTEFKKVEGDYLRDDEFGDLIEQLRAKLGKNGDVAVVMDLCHSGSATRGELISRGSKPPIVSTTFKAGKVATADNLKEFRENAKASRGDNNNLATYVVISAARADEAAYETDNDDSQKMGALSYAFCKSMETLPDSTSYRSLFAKIEAIIDIKSNIQHPVLEGNGIQRGLFGGQFVTQKPFIEVESIDVDNKKIRIKAGLFSGVDEGAIISFYPSTTSDPAKANPLTSGKVTKANQFTADVTVDKNTGKQFKDIWAFVTEPVYKIKPIVVKINEDNPRGMANKNRFSEAESNKIKADLKSMGRITYGNVNADLLLLKGEGHDSLIVANNGYLFATTEKYSLEENLKAYSKYKYLKELDVKDNTIKVEVRLGKLINGKVEYMKPSKTIKGYEYLVGETMIIAVKNTSKTDVYVNILDFEPNGKINPIFPNKGLNKPIQSEEMKVPAGKEITYKDYQIKIGPPLGTEVLKVFVSDTEIDMEGVASGARGRGLMTALEGVFADASEHSRGGEVLNLKDAKGVVFNIPFQIKASKQ